MRQLILFRHAKTEPYSETGSDETRRLTDRGHEDAQTVSFQLKAMNVRPTQILVSTARRTRETVAEFQKSFPEAPVTFSERLYLADPEEISGLIEALPDTNCLVVIGHNPGIHELAMQLTEYGGYSNSMAASQLRVKFPTAAMAVFEAKENDPFNAYNFKLAEFFTPRSLTDA
ncbi:MAG: phosphohistidine phosphatase [Ponticaulis sp.]|nr:phosphohistidine phosphatase [Ponticaulis sp.]|tara:strand:+ start:41438 stop:41956 length:519 start_codon:yes stop_codon:yes gene_type:complete